MICDVVLFSAPELSIPVLRQALIQSAIIPPHPMHIAIFSLD
jgi:hypothetical protein